MSRLVLIIGQMPDPHIDSVAGQLRERGAIPIEFDCLRPGHALELHVGPSGPWGMVYVDGRSWRLDEVGAVWWRFKPTMSASYPKAANMGIRSTFILSEWRAALRALPEFLPHAVWLNPLTAHLRVAGGKPWQLLLAREFGLAIPETRFCNVSEAVLALFEQHSRLAYKTVDSFIIPPDELIFTNEISRDMVVASRDEIALTPGTFQEMIVKKHELRVTIVGREVFPVRIDSQKSARTRIDWRHDQFENMYEVVDLDPILEAQLLAFHERAGLVFGAYDLIVPEEGPAVFLECNPGGQWLWLEIALGLQISRAVADVLAEASPPRAGVVP